MASELKPSPLPKALTLLLITAAVVNGFVLAIELVQWGWYGQANGPSILGSTAVEFLAVSVLVERRRRLSLVLLAIGWACVLASLLLRLWR
jgi:hypothetical protein